jgi:G3E family GTPase
MDSICNLYVHRENSLWGAKKKQLPVTLVTGFLGAGKTTLLNHVLTNKHNLRIAAAVNDFASVNIDGQIVRGNIAHDSVVELTNGCLCCSIASEFKTAVWNLLQDADIGKIDYLMIETSGVSDPLATIATLEQEYGRMYRIRLDAVITVVDTDALAAQLEDGDMSVIKSAAADSQLKCADVVLLNKQDLVSEAQLKKAKDFIESYIPGVQVYACVKSAVPLHYIMEVSEVSAGPMLVSHEVTESAYRISTEGGIMNQERRKRMKDSQVDSGSGHIAQDEFTSLVFESSEPFSLGAFQAFLGKNFPRGTSRMKGTVWFAENRSNLYSFHMSGRQRYEMVLCSSIGDSLSGAFSVQLVAIGRGIDAGAVEASLKNCIASPTSNSLSQPTESSVAAPPPTIDLLAQAQSLVKDDRRFELIDEPGVTRYIDFRVTGVIEYGVTVQEAANVHGIDFTRMNSELVRRVNGSSGPVSLLPVFLPVGVQVCRHAVSPDVSFSEAWMLIQEVAKKLIDEFYRAVGYCKCGM